MAAITGGDQSAQRGSNDSGVRKFAGVNVSLERVIRTVVGLRPYRPAGFVVRREQFGDKSVVHNYGHGGGGVSLSWGTAQLALELAVQTQQRHFAVLGCGAVGLATARLLQDAGFVVTIYAKELPPQTTSNIAGAQWSPVSVFDAAQVTPAFRAQFERASRFSYHYFQNLVGDHYGVRRVENYAVSSAPDDSFTDYVNETGISDLYPDMLALPAGAHSFPYRHVTRFSTLFIEPPVYLDAVLRDFLLHGGKVEVRQFESIKDVLALAEPVIVNCTGLGATLFGDKTLVPIKGQLSVLPPQPEIDYLTLGPGPLYMFSRRDGILLGGTFEHGVSTLDPNEAARLRIIKAHRQFFENVSVHSPSGG